MDVSIIIVNWNTKDDLRAAIESCYAHGPGLDIEVIVVDNGSTDGSAEMVRADFPQATLIANDDNVGYTRAGNQGMNAASGRYYLMLNSDAQLTEGCLAELVRVMDTYADIGTATARLQYADGSAQEAAHRFPTLSSRLLPAALVSAAERVTDQTPDNGAPFYAVDWVLGACQILRTETVAQVGMMDERIFMWYDDADWCLRMAKASWRRVVARHAVCVHEARKSAGALPPLRRNLQVSMSEYTYFRLHHGRTKTAILWAARTLYSAVKAGVLASGTLLTLGLCGSVRRLCTFNWQRLVFHLRYAADILWQEPKPYRADDVE